MKEVIMRLTSDHIKVKGGKYVQDLVRCGECKHKFYCCRGGIPTDDKGFCSDGEVRDE